MRLLQLPWVLLLALAALLVGCRFGPGVPPPVTPRLAYLGLDDHVYTIPAEGGDPRRLSAGSSDPVLPAGQRVAQWPTWSRDGSRLAYFRFDIARGSTSRANVFAVGVDGADQVKLFESEAELPIYMAWSPDSASLGLLSQRGSEFRLQLLDAAAARAAREVARGSPLYFAWAPDAQSVVVHANGDGRSNDRATLGLWRAAGGSSAALPLPTRPGDFRAPAWSPDGSRMAYVAAVPGGQSALAVQEPSRPDVTRLAVVGAEAAFVWSPNSERLAFSSRLTGDVPLYRGIETLKPDGGDRRQVTEDQVTAFYWSPDGKRLAYAALDVSNRTLVWNVVDADGKNRKQVGSFVPSEEQLFAYRFFDQFAQSHGVWSPDGKYLVYAGQLRAGARSRVAPEGPGVPGGDSGSEPSQVFVAPSDGSASPRALVDGSFGTWPVPPPRR